MKKSCASFGLFLVIHFFAGCASHSYDKEADSFRRAIDLQNHAANVSRKIVLREVFFTKKPLSVVVDSINDKLDHGGAKMKIRLRIVGGGIPQSLIDELMERPVTLKYTAIGLQDVVHEIAEQADLYIIYEGDFITLTSSDPKTNR